MRNMQNLYDIMKDVLHAARLRFHDMDQINISIEGDELIFTFKNEQTQIKHSIRVKL